MAFDVVLRDGGGGFDVALDTASNDKTGSVTGSTTFSGAIVGRKATTKAVAGTITFTGTVVGKEGEPGAVVGVITYSGTVAGTKAATGALASAITYSGLIVGTADDPDRAATTRRGGKPTYRLWAQAQPEQEQPVEHRTGRVSGRIRFSGTVAGRKTGTARRLAAPILYRCEIRGSKSTSGYAVNYTRMTGAVRGVGITLIGTAEIRRMRQEIDLLHLTRGRP
jgi:hypothetical protein